MFLREFSSEVVDSGDVHNYLQGFNNFIYFLRGVGYPFQWTVNSGQWSVTARE
jgi:hypothetical protein